MERLKGGECRVIALPPFPSLTRPFGDKVLESFRTFLYFTTIIEADLDAWSILDLLEFALVVQYFDPESIYIKSVVMLVLSKLTRCNEITSFNEIWDILVALSCLDSLYENAQYFLPQMLFFPHCNAIGMCGELPIITQRYQQIVNAQIPKIVIGAK